MSSIADNLPPEILSEIFGHTEAWFRQWDARTTPERHDHIEPSCVPQTVPNFITSTAPFTDFRLVSRQWKTVADTFFFREVAVNLGFGPDDGDSPGNDADCQLGNDAYYHQSIHRPGSQIMKLVLDNDYTSLIRHLHIRLSLDKEKHNFPDRSPDWDESDLDFVIPLLHQFQNFLFAAKSCAILHLYLQLYPIAGPCIRQAAFAKATVEEIQDALIHCPNMRLELSISLPTDPYAVVGYFLGSQADYLMEYLPDSVLSATNHLELELHDHLHHLIPSRLFDSFRSMTKICLQKVVQPLQAPGLQAIENGLLSMPCLEHVDLCAIPISVFPKHLRSLKLDDVYCKPEMRFWRNITDFENLEVLQVSFFETIDWAPLEPEVPVDWSQIATIRLPELRTLEVSTRLLSSNLNSFCERVLHDSPSLRNLKLVGVVVSDKLVTGLRQQSLETFILTYHNHDFYRDFPGADSATTACRIVYWSGPKAMLKRSPRIRLFQLGIDNRLVPFSFRLINDISLSCPELACIQIFYRIMEREQREELERNVNDCRWLYFRGRAGDGRRDAIMKEVIRMPNITWNEPQEIIIDLERFRMLKNQVAEE
jgi:hypothetical protein